MYTYPFWMKSTFFSGKMLRIWLSTWSALVWLVRVTLYWAWKTIYSYEIRCSHIGRVCKVPTRCFIKKLPPEQKGQRIESKCRCESDTTETLILRGPSRGPLFLLGVSIVMTLSKPLSRLPNTFPPFRFCPLSTWQPARSSDRDLETCEIKLRTASVNQWHQWHPSISFFCCGTHVLQ